MPAKNSYLRWLFGLNLLVALLSLLALIAPQVNPRYFWPMTIIGLSMPLLLLGHLLFALFWLFRQKTQALLSLAVLVASGPSISGLYGFTSPRLPINKGLKIVSQNVRRLESYPDHNKTVTPAAFQQHLQNLQADVLCLQEFIATPAKRQPYLEALHAVGLKHIIHDPERSSLLIAARFPLQSIKNHYYENLVNGYQIAELELGNRTINLINVHLRTNQITNLTNHIAEEGSLKKKETWRDIGKALAKYKNATITRTQQAQNITRSLASFQDPSIICGDFNDTSQSYPYQLLKGQRKDAFLQKGHAWGSTYAGKIPGLRIDFLLYDPTLKVQHCQRGPAAFSDHYPLIAYFE